MKKAVGYVRISDSDQSNWSLDGQEKDIRKYCERNNIELLTIFRDDGQSAKNFDRAEWKELYTFIKKHHKNLDEILVIAYDRFSRNVSEALDMIERLEKQFEIYVVSITQPIALHRQSPYYFQFRAQMLISAEFELHIIRDRTKTGMVRAAREGRFVAKAPFGYINSRDEKNKPVIVIDKNKMEVVKKVFRLYLQGATQSQILKMIPELKYRSISSVTRMLCNPVYAGLINVPAFYDEPEQIVSGLHKGIISESEYWQVCKMLNNPQPKIFHNEAVPLRCVVNHDCQKLLTAGNSKGKKSYYWYYVCLRCKKNYSANIMHKQFEEILNHLKLSASDIEKITKKVSDGIKERMKANTKSIEKAKADLQQVKKKIVSLEEKYIADDIDRGTYKKWKINLETERLALENSIVDMNVPAARIWSKFEDKIEVLTNLSTLYKQASIHAKQAFIRLVFNSALSYSDGIYRTLYILPLFASKVALLKEKRLLYVEKPFEVIGENTPCAPGGT